MTSTKLSPSKETIFNSRVSTAMAIPSKLKAEGTEKNQAPLSPSVKEVYLHNLKVAALGPGLDFIRH